MGVVLSFAESTAQARIRYVQAPPKALPDGGQGSAKTDCPNGTHVLGGGQYVFSGLYEANLVTSTPYDGRDRGRAPDDGWKSSVRSFDADNTLTMFAICAGHKPSYVKDAFRVGGLQTFTGRMRCGNGAHVIGGGVRLPVSYDDAGWLRSSAPFDGNDVGAKPDDGWKATGGVEERQVDMAVTAICGSAQLKYGVGEGTASPKSFGEAFADCPGRSRLVGGGMSAASGALGNAMTISSPFDDADPNGRLDDGWQGEFDNYSFTDPGQITAFAICQA